MGVDFLDVCDCCFGVCDGLLGVGVAVVFRAEVAVHADSSDEGALAFCEANICEEVRG